MTYKNTSKPDSCPTILKFGGTSVGDAVAFERAAEIIQHRQFMRPVVVVSAMSGMTDVLLSSVTSASEKRVQAAIASLTPEFQRHLDVSAELLSDENQKQFGLVLEAARAEILELLQKLATFENNRALLQDSILAFGERLSSFLLTLVLQTRGCNAQPIDARQLIITDEQHGRATPLTEETFFRTRNMLGGLVEDGLVAVLGGFIGATQAGATTTLGRGGSDYSAALIGAALGAREIQIWTDVSGVLTADPRVVSDARPIRRLSYGEAAELAYFGAKVLHPKTIQPAVENSIPVRICNSCLPDEQGTLVADQTDTSPRTVKSIAHKVGVTTIQITSARMLGAYGFLRALFEVFERHRTAVDVVTTSEVSVSLSLDDVTSLPAILDDLEKLGTVRVEPDRAIVCVVGEGLRGTPGIAAEVFNTISDINVTLISQGASSINLTFAIEEARVGEAVQRLHAAFFGMAAPEESESVHLMTNAVAT